MSKTNQVPFRNLCLGAKFQFVDDHPQGTWVKIGHNKVAEWDKQNVTTRRIQSICIFCYDESTAFGGDGLNQKVVSID